MRIKSGIPNLDINTLTKEEKVKEKREKKGFYKRASRREIVLALL